ncbi:gliding motility lipoprotein GldB [Winogradskyella haliclonae]|uniref:Gliding motility lipoprotein GldB n=1 Tax=Winogradskyella haliclonae TaxID=2048558 RepID=A0ABQ2BVB1_9FLAO|nr:gliding motility lipoprotein GldB [Winogradskyella haliclonae]GGI55760.1 gliding motility lipoprotein GldB [Winogradskyella haliclonae]
MKVKLKHVVFNLLLLLFWTCQNENVLEKEIAQVDVDFTVERFDEVLLNTDAEKLPKVKETFPFLFPKYIADSSWIERIKDDLQQQMFSEGKHVFGDFKIQRKEIERFFQHIKYYDKTFKLPRVITVADYVDYRNKLVLQNDLLIINMMNYLGQDHEFYQNTPMYFAERMRPDQILPEIAEKYANRYQYQSQRKTFLDEIIYHGKLLYFKDVMIPEFTDADKIGYTIEDMKWANENESQIWSYFVEKELLFSTDPKLFTRFTVPAPFSKFYLELDNESPGRIGQYIGWQIVRAYAERTDTDIMTLMRTDSEEIFKKSKYKPKR